MYLGYILFIGLSGPVIMEPPPPSNEPEDCGNISANDCLKKLQTFLRLNALPYTSKGSELDNLCDQAVGGYNCSSLMFQNPTCLNPKDKELLPLFIEMAEYTYLMLCGNDRNPGYLRTDFLQNSDCVIEHKEKMECCALETKLPDLPVMMILEESSKSLAERQILACCPVSSYLKCTRKVIAENCGEAASNFTSEYIRRAAGQQMQAVCQELPEYPDPDPKLCPKPSLKCSGCRTLHLNEQLLIILVSVLWLRWLL